MQIDFSDAFERASHSGFLYKLQDGEAGSAVLDAIAGLLSCRAQRVVTDAMRFNDVFLYSSDVSQG